MTVVIGFSFKTDNNKKDTLFSEKKNEDSLYIPKNKDILLFYIQLSENHNIIVYDVNYNPDKTINEQEPLHTYWIRYSENGQSKELTYFQRHLVYGLETKLIDKEKQAYIVKFVSYKKRKIYINKTETDFKHNAYMDIQGKISLLSKIFIQVEPGTFGLPTVKYVELHGKEIATNKAVMERIVP
jgi:hypothetical protein